MVNTTPKRTPLFKKGFTLAEVLITIVMLGIVFMIALPSVVDNTQQIQFRTGLRKALSTLNTAITLNIAITGESPYDNVDLFGYLQQRMSVVRSTTRLPWTAKYVGWGKTVRGSTNAAFYTNDGMRYEMDDNRGTNQQFDGNYLKLHESDHHACLALAEATNPDYAEGTEIGSWAGKQPNGKPHEYVQCNGCGSMGLGRNPNGTTKVPCAILVDVNGDKRPTPQKVFDTPDEGVKEFIESKYDAVGKEQDYWVPDLSSRRMSDLFTILITEDRAIPYGIIAQKAMYSGGRDKNLWGNSDYSVDSSSGNKKRK